MDALWAQGLYPWKGKKQVKKKGVHIFASHWIRSASPGEPLAGKDEDPMATGILDQSVQCCWT